jgi:transcriptional regulator with XRE-family HTH domain
VKRKKSRKGLPLFPLKAVLLEKEVSQYRLAKETGMTQAAVNALANGRRLPRWDNVLAIAKYLGVELNAFEPEQYEAREKRTRTNGEAVAAG